MVIDNSSRTGIACLITDRNSACRSVTPLLFVILSAMRGVRDTINVWIGEKGTFFI